MTTIVITVGIVIGGPGLRGAPCAGHAAGRRAGGSAPAKRVLGPTGT